MVLEIYNFTSDNARPEFVDYFRLQHCPSLYYFNVPVYNNVSSTSIVGIDSGMTRDCAQYRGYLLFKEEFRNYVQIWG